MTKRVEPSPLITWSEIPLAAANVELARWEHFLGPYRRPFGRQAFGLFLGDALASVAVSGSTVNKKCGGFARSEVVELARLCTSPSDRDLTRVVLRLWRKTAAQRWEDRYWPVVAYVSYANAIRHKGDVYRFDGWTKVADVRGKRAGRNSTWTRPRKDCDPKSVWGWRL